MHPKLASADIAPWGHARLWVGHPGHDGGHVTFAFPHGGSPSDLVVLSYEVNGWGVTTEPTPADIFLSSTAMKRPVGARQSFAVVLRSTAATEVHVVLGLAGDPAPDRVVAEFGSAEGHQG
jgi:hypothetical protein